jgi:hypothetical protein
VGSLIGRFVVGCPLSGVETQRIVQISPPARRVKLRRRHQPTRSSSRRIGYKANHLKMPLPGEARGDAAEEVEKSATRLRGRGQGGRRSTFGLRRGASSAVCSAGGHIGRRVEDQQFTFTESPPVRNISAGDRYGGAPTGGFRDRCCQNHVSVARGCPTPAYVMCTIIFSGLGQYQIRPPPVTSYCHCSNSLPLMVRVARSSLSWAWRAGFERSRGARVSASQAVRVAPRACLQRSSQPSAASASWKKRAHSPSRGGGLRGRPSLSRFLAPRSYGRGTRLPVGAGRGPVSFASNVGSA